MAFTTGDGHICWHLYLEAGYKATILESKTSKNKKIIAFALVEDVFI